MCGALNFIGNFLYGSVSFNIVVLLQTGLKYNKTPHCDNLTNIVYRCPHTFVPAILLHGPCRILYTANSLDICLTEVACYIYYTMLPNYIVLYIQDDSLSIQNF